MKLIVISRKTNELQLRIFTKCSLAGGIKLKSLMMSTWLEDFENPDKWISNLVMINVFSPL